MNLLVMSAMSFPEWSPALFEIDLGFAGLGKFPIRWYALGYIVGLMMAWRYALFLIRRPILWGGTSAASATDIDDLLFYAMLGVILGGRLGYIVFYQLPYQWDRTLADPWSLLRVWEGGMSFHGGMIGVALAVIVLARQRGVRLLSIADIGGATAGFGIFLVRIANFINAELYGRTTDSAWGMVFPEGRVPGSTPGAYNWQTGDWVYNGTELPRYPSQLYEAVLEGLIPVVVTLVLVWQFKALRRPGLVAGVFLLLYGIGRSIAERFREPDAFVQGLPEWLTMGQILSMPMWAGGLWLIWNAYKSSQPVSNGTKAT